jgi:hypothetical protein
METEFTAPRGVVLAFPQKTRDQRLRDYRTGCLLAELVLVMQHLELEQLEQLLHQVNAWRGK